MIWSFKGYDNISIVSLFISFLLRKDIGKNIETHFKKSFKINNLSQKKGDFKKVTNFIVHFSLPCHHWSNQMAARKILNLKKYVYDVLKLRIWRRLMKTRNVTVLYNKFK